MKKLLLLLSVMTTALFTFAQNVSLSGKVTDSAGVGLPGINIQEKGTRKGTVTQPDGAFTISVPSNATLVISGVGFATRELSVNGQTSLSVTLVETASELNNVVVTALGITKQARKVSYAVTTVGNELLSTARDNNVANNLSGRVAGLKVTGTSSGPGGTAKVLL